MEKIFADAKKIAKALRYYLHHYSTYYIYPIYAFNDDFEWCGVYLNDMGKVCVRLDDDSEYCIIQPCPSLISRILEAPENTKESEAYYKFKEFFENIVATYEIESIANLF